MIIIGVVVGVVLGVKRHDHTPRYDTSTVYSVTVQADAASSSGATPSSSPTYTTTSLVPQSTSSGSAGLEAIRRRYNVPGLAVGHVKNRSTTREVVGVRKHGDSTPLGNDDKFHIGGCTMSLTAILAASLVEQGFFRWNTTMSEIFQEFDLHRLHSNTSIGMLATNTAGLMAGSRPEEYKSWWSQFRNDSLTAVEVRRQFAQSILANAPLSTPVGHGTGAYRDTWF